MASSYSTFLTSNPEFELDNHFPPPRPLVDNHDLTEAYDIDDEKVRRSQSTKTSKSAGSSQLLLSRISFLRTPPTPGPSSPRSLKSTVRTFNDPPRNRICKAVSSVFSRKRNSDIGIPIQEVPSRNDLYAEVEEQMRTWSPLHIEKKPQSQPQPRQPCQHCRCKDKRRRKQGRFCLALLVIVLLYLLANTIVLNVKVFSDGNTSDGQLGTSNNTYTLSKAQELCLLEFEVNAPSNASLYPCSTCLSKLQQIPSDFGFSNASDSQLLSNSIQFCGMQSLLSASSGVAQSGLVNGGWGQDTSFCTWTGVQCNSQGQVQNLTMTFPDVPSVIPDGISALSTMQTLKITGGNSLPGGSLPSSFSNLTSLKSLDLESTGLSALPSNLFSSGAISGLTSLTLVKNTGFEGSLPDLSALSLSSLTVDNQQVTTPLQTLLGGSGLQSSLATFSMISANLTGTFPDASFSHLQTLALNDNPTTSGSLPSSLCSSSTLSSCDLSNTGFSNKANCGKCKSS